MFTPESLAALVAPAQRRSDAAEHRRHIKRRGFPVPPWETPQEREAVDAFVAACPTGKSIDHIAPLGHPEVVGLHVRVNLQYLAAEENNRKGNRLPDGLTPAEAVERRMAIWRRDIDPVTGVVNWGRYAPVGTPRRV